VDFSDFSAAARVLTLSMNTSMGFLRCLKLTSTSAQSSASAVVLPGAISGTVEPNFMLAATPQGT